MTTRRRARLIKPRSGTRWQNTWNGGHQWGRTWRQSSLRRVRNGTLWLGKRSGAVLVGGAVVRGPDQQGPVGNRVLVGEVGERMAVFVDDVDIKIRGAGMADA